VLPRYADPSAGPLAYLNMWWIDPAKARALGGQAAASSP
jgi:hypothetical protein